MSAEQDNEFEVLLDFIRRNRGFDFTGYKRPSLIRRFEKRMGAVGVATFGEYQDYLEVHPDEFGLLFNTILINVTSFFRDAASWEYVRNEVVPKIVADKKPQENIRVWVAGCAGGHEAYTSAMVVAEAVGSEQFRDRVKIYATDVDEEALNQARQASYSQSDVESIPSDLLEKYFEKSNGNYVFRKDLRRSVIFGRNDLTKDEPISRIDLLVCRNTLMYFNAETQSRILAHYHFALNSSGYLFLGKGEMLLTRANIFNPVDLRRRVFTKVLRENGAVLAHSEIPVDTETEDVVSRVRLRELAYDIAPVAQLVVGLSGQLVQANDSARSLFRLGPQDIGRPLQDLEASYRPVEARSLIAQAYTERRPVNLKQVEWVNRSGTTHVHDVVVSPLMDTNGNLMGAAVSFVDVTRYRRLQEELEKSRQDLETAYEELQSTIEELETTNEELQSTNEELETTNEELQSTNEELETMNEELQSTNEELETINAELRERTSELNRVNGFLESILASLRAGVAVLDRELHVQVWNNRAEDLWGLREEEVRGRNFLSLDIGLPVHQLTGLIRSSLHGEPDSTEAVLDAINRRGKAILCRVTTTPLSDSSNGPQGVILLMEDSARQTAGDGATPPA